MRILLKRWIVYLLLPAGLVLLFAPLNTSLSEMTETPFVFLEISETLGEMPQAKSIPTLSADASMESLTAQLTEAQEFLSDQESTTATLTNSVGLPILPFEALAPYPALQASVEEMMDHIRLRSQEQLRERRLDEVPVEEWESFQSAYTAQGAFQVGNRIFKGHTELALADMQMEVEHLKTGCKGAGGLFLLLGAWLLYGLYAPPTHGIRVGNRGTIILWDLIIIGIGSLFMWMTIDFLLHRTLGTEWWGGDEMMAGMGVFWVLLVTPLMAFITTATAIQTLWITQEGIALKGLTGLRALPWSEVTDIQLSGIRGPQSATGGHLTKTVTRHLVITGKSDSLRILEPPFASTKKEILSAMETFAPAEMKEGLSALTKEWSSLW
jgi:hypothetical protein